MTQHTGEAHLEATLDVAATAKVGAKGEAHLDMLQDAGDGGLMVKIADDRPEKQRPLMAIPKQRRR